VKPPPQRKVLNQPYLSDSGYYYVEVEEVDTGRHYSMPLHRLVWEEHNKQRIPKGHVIHHKNGDKLDNSTDNLQKMTAAAHRRHHKEYRKKKRILKKVLYLNRRIKSRKRK